VLGNRPQGVARSDHIGGLGRCRDHLVIGRRQEGILRRLGRQCLGTPRHGDLLVGPTLQVTGASRGVDSCRGCIESHR